MKANLFSILNPNKRSNGVARPAVVLLLFLSVSKGTREEETRIFSSQQTDDQDSIKILISESVKSTSVNSIFENVFNSAQNVIHPTERLTNSSYLEIRKETPTIERLANDCQKTKETIKEHHKINPKSRSKDYYDIIKPTKTFSVKELKIEQTEISKTDSGESKGVSMSQSRPLKALNAMSYKRAKRGFDDFSEEPNEDQKSNSKIYTSDEAKRKLTEKNNLGKNYNHIEQTLRKIAKVTINNEKEQPMSPTITSVNFRESREEENRKASPDIQDIITGIVNILNGKATKQNEGNSGRPRPTGMRINNRGPPRISDVPPLDFDGPPAYRPLPPPLPPKRIYPPYPFDIPPVMPNIPLPPQPLKPSKLPSHPFIDGVPIPKIVIPEEQSNKPSDYSPPEEVKPQYDTISMSEPVTADSISPIISTKATQNSEKPLDIDTNTTQKNESEKVQPNKIKIDNITLISNNNRTASADNSTINKPEKIKISGQKTPSSNSSVNKNANKRVRPNPVNRSTEKPDHIKATPASAGSDEKYKTNHLQADRNVSELTTTEVSQLGQKNENQPPKEKILNETKKAENPLKESTNVSTVLNIKPVKEMEIKKNKTASSVATLPPISQTHDEATKPIPSDKIEDDLKPPVLLEPSVGIGEATPVLESSILEISMLSTEQTKTATAVMTTQRIEQPLVTAGGIFDAGTSHEYKVRPGIVLDDPEYKPGGHKRPVITARPIITAPPPHSHYGEIFDVTVHAVQGPEESPSGKPIIVPVNIDGVQVHNSQMKQDDVSVITKPEDGQNFVSIDGKRTYINLFGEVSSTKINPTTTQPPITGTGYAIPHKESPVHSSNVRPTVSTSPPRRPYKRPSHPPVRIDTCIVGDDTTCDSAQNEMCRTEDGVSSCHCRPGYNRRNHRDTCRRVVSMVTSLRVDRLYDRKVKWQDNLRDPDSEEYQQLSYEASQAIESAMSMTPFSDDFINSRINSIYTAKNLENNEPAVYVNITIQLEENLDTVRPAVRHDIQRHLLRVIQRRNNNVGNSAVWVDASPGSVLALQDVDECSSWELHDCHDRAVCMNTFGSFRCQCPSGSRDPWVGNIHREGRFCEMCSSEYCNNRGECNFEHGQQVCHCSGSFYGTQCEIDGEVLGVAIGASVAAAIIIILTLICLCMWSRRWSREQKSAVGAGMGSPVFGYMATGPTVKTPSVGSPPYQVSIEDRIRWAQIADVMAKSNHYAQPEPVNTTTRTSFGGYPTLPSHTLNMKGTLPLPTITPPVPLPRLTLANKQPMGTYGAHSQFGSIHQSNQGLRSSIETSSSEEDADRVDLLGRNFNAPRPKSRTSVANQSGIYYDVDFDRSDAYSKQNTIPLNTYTLNPQHQVRPYFR